MAANSNQEALIQKFGYAEMYEWANIPMNGVFGKFVQFSRRKADKIEATHDGLTHLLGVSTICAVSESDDPLQWKDAYLYNEVGDLFMKKETLAVGIKQYDQDLEMSYIMTKPWQHHIKVKNPKYDEKQKYVGRTGRREWVRVTLLGKAIVNDSGDCKPGSYCKPYDGSDMQKAGFAVPAEKGEENSFYVLERMSPTSVKIILK